MGVPREDNQIRADTYVAGREVNPAPSLVWKYPGGTRGTRGGAEPPLPYLERAGLGPHGAARGLTRAQPVVDQHPEKVFKHRRVPVAQGMGRKLPPNDRVVRDGKPQGPERQDLKRT